MRKVTNPPEEYEDAYDAVKDCYDAYMKLTNLVINPRGNLQSFSNNFNDARDELLRCFKGLDLYT